MAFSWSRFADSLLGLPLVGLTCSLSILTVLGFLGNHLEGKPLQGRYALFLIPLATLFLFRKTFDRLAFRSSEYLCRSRTNEWSCMACLATAFYDRCRWPPGRGGAGGYVIVYDIFEYPLDFFIKYSRCWTDPPRVGYKAIRFRMVHGLATNLMRLGLKNVLIYPAVSSDWCLLSASQSSEVEGQVDDQRFFVVDFSHEKLWRLDLGVPEETLSAIGTVALLRLRFFAQLGPSGELEIDWQRAALAVNNYRKREREHAPLRALDIMNLPTDIRVMVYDLVLGAGHFVFHGAGLSPRYVVERSESGLGLLCVSRRVSDEFRGVLERYRLQQPIMIQISGHENLLSMDFAGLTGYQRRLLLLVQIMGSEWHREGFPHSDESDIVETVFTKIDMLCKKWPISHFRVLVAEESGTLIDSRSASFADRQWGAAQTRDRIEGQIAQRAGTEICFDTVVLSPIKGKFQGKDLIWYAVTPLQTEGQIISAFRAAHETALLDLLAYPWEQVACNPFIRNGLMWTTKPPDVCSVADARKLDGLMPETRWQVWKPGLRTNASN